MIYFKKHRGFIDWCNALDGALEYDHNSVLTEDDVLINFGTEDLSSTPAKYYGTNAHDRQLNTQRYATKKGHERLGISVPPTVAEVHSSQLDRYKTKDYIIKPFYEAPAYRGDCFDALSTEGDDTWYYIEDTIQIKNEYSVMFLTCNGEYKILHRANWITDMTQSENSLRYPVCYMTETHPPHIEEFLSNYIALVVPKLTSNSGHGVQMMEAVDGKLYIAEHNPRLGNVGCPKKLFTHDITQMFVDVANGKLPTIERVSGQVKLEY